MKAEEFREKFIEFMADSDRYKTFVVLINKRGRLLFWQERVLEKFCGNNELEVPSFSSLQEIFGVCELHGVPLEQGTVKIFRGHVDYSREYTKACLDRFPNSYLSEVNGPEELHGKYIPVRICPVCRKAENAWKDKSVSPRRSD